MSVRARRRRWSELLLRPQVLVASLALLAAVLWFAGGIGSGAATSDPRLSIDAQVEPRLRTDVPIVVVDRDGLQRTQLIEVETIDSDVARLAGAMTVLRGTLVTAGDWPTAVPAPHVYVYERQRQRVAVIDVPALPDGTGVDLLAAWATLRSLRETAFAHGLDEVEVVVGGAPSTSLWGQVALR